MAGESSEPRPVAVTLPPSLDEWLAERAETADTDREELLVQLAATYRATVEEDDVTAGLTGAVEEAATDAATERVDNRLEYFRSSLDSQLQAIRRRVVQLKHESDEKADRSRVERLSTRVDGLEESLDDLDDSVGSLREEVEALRGEFEDRSAAGSGTAGADETATGDRHAAGHDGAAAERALAERVDDLDSKLVRVARAVVQLREEDDADERRSGPLRGLKRVAAREGVREATCAACAGTVDIGLLPDAACPHCDARFRELAVEPVAGGAPRLDVAREPGATDEEESAREDPAGDGEGAIAGGERR